VIIDAPFHQAVERIIALAAESAIMPRFGRLQDSDMREKVADELVTIADHESERILADGLHRLLPEALIVGEEAADADSSVMERLGSGLCWIIDPLDGTGNFVSGEGPFGILVALAECGEAIGGWIYDPQSGRLCSAVRGNGAFIGGQSVASCQTATTAPVAAISTLLEKDERSAELKRQLAGKFSITSMPRCAAEQYPKMVLGGAQASFFGRTLPWDHAAGVLFLTEAGGRVTRFDGAAYRVDDDQTGLVAAVSENFWLQAMAAAGAAGL
jgi:fructose-1,6-bisphosphatase/inositol monophosphatase family enzyme